MNIIMKIAFVIFVGQPAATADTYVTPYGSVTYVRNADGTAVADLYVKDGQIIGAGTLRMEQAAQQ